MNIGKQCLYERSTSFFEPRTDIILGRTISHNVVEPLISGSSLTTSSNIAQLLINHENCWAILHISVLFHMLFAQLKTPFLTSIANSFCSYRTMSSVTWIRKPETDCLSWASFLLNYLWLSPFILLKNLIYLHDPHPHPIRGRDLVSPVAGWHSADLQGASGKIMPSSSQRYPHPNLLNLWLSM